MSWAGAGCRLNSGDFLVTAPITPNASMGSIPNEDRGAGMAVSKPTSRPLAAADPFVSLQIFFWIRNAIRPRTAPTGNEIAQPTPAVATSSPNNIQSTVNNPNAVN